MTEAKPNYNFEESYMSLKQIEVTNDLGYDVEHLELVLIAAMFGEVRTFDGIANGAVGLINLDSEREINTNQIDTGDTFVLGDPVYFHTVNKVLEVTGASGNVAVGTCTVVNNGVSVGFRPYKQNLNATGLVVT